MVGRRLVKPVFVDRSGRRRRLLVTVGVAIGAALLGSLGLLLAGGWGSGIRPLPGWPDPGARIGQEPSAQPSPAPAPVTPRPPVPASRPAPTSEAAVPSVAPTSTDSNPGQGDEHRRTARPTKSPGKPG